MMAAKFTTEKGLASLIFSMLPLERLDSNQIEKRTRGSSWGGDVGWGRRGVQLVGVGGRNQADIMLKQSQSENWETWASKQNNILRYLPSPTSKSLNASSEPESSSRISPFKVNIIVCSFMSTMHPTTSPANQERPKCSLPWCHRCAWKGFKIISNSTSNTVHVPFSLSSTTNNSLTELRWQ